MEIAGKDQTDSQNQWQATEFNINDPKNLVQPISIIGLLRGMWVQRKNLHVTVELPSRLGELVQP